MESDDNGGAGAQIPRFASQKWIKPFISSELTLALKSPILSGIQFFLQNGRLQMRNYLLIAVSTVMFLPYAAAHKFPLEQGVQESDILRLEIIENVVDPCYMTIAWEKEVEATLQHGESDVLARLKLSAYDEIEATVNEVTPLVRDLKEPADRMHVYAKLTGLCVKALQ